MIYQINAAQIVNQNRQMRFTSCAKSLDSFFNLNKLGSLYACDNFSLLNSHSKINQYTDRHRALE